MSFCTDLIEWYNESKFSDIEKSVGKLAVAAIIDSMQKYLQKDDSDDALSLLKAIFLGKSLY